MYKTVSRCRVVTRGEQPEDSNMSENRTLADACVPQFELQPVECRPVVRESICPVYADAGPSAQYVIGNDAECVICRECRYTGRDGFGTGGYGRGGYVIGYGDGGYLRESEVSLCCLIFLIAELLLGIATLFVEAFYEVNTLFIRHYSYFYLRKNYRQYLVSARLIYATTCAMPVFVFCLILAICFSGRRSRLTVIIILISCVGFICYLAAGIVCLVFPKHHHWVPNNGKLTFEILSIVTAVVYLVHVIYKCIRSY